MTLEQVQDRLAAYLAAETAILKAQEYTIGQGSTARKLTRADLEQVQKGIATCRAEITLLQSVASRTRRVTYLRPF